MKRSQLAQVLIANAILGGFGGFVDDVPKPDEVRTTKAQQKRLSEKRMKNTKVEHEHRTIGTD